MSIQLSTDKVTVSSFFLLLVFVYVCMSCLYVLCA